MAEDGIPEDEENGQGAGSRHLFWLDITDLHTGDDPSSSQTLSDQCGAQVPGSLHAGTFSTVACEAMAENDPAPDADDARTLYRYCVAGFSPASPKLRPEMVPI